jgi:phosphatidylserine/phosphatidylglycerophosphate/cardiolipin synthase-like enzyme
MRLGFTRGYLTSQAYARQFKNAPIRPDGAKGLFNTTPYQKQYEWLGYHARELVFGFLDECINDPNCTLDVFAFDLDEPDVVAKLVALKSRLRIILDDSTLHTKPGAVEIDADKQLVESAGMQNVHRGHFSRFSHDKVLIQKRRGQPARVLTGSANFSVRGLYVQANNVMVIDDPGTAALYERAFEESFRDMRGFASTPIAAQWFEQRAAGLPNFSVCFSPHENAETSLGQVGAAIQKARSSVLFAVMELGGGGEVLDDLRKLAGEGHVFSYGVTQSAKGISVYKPGAAHGVLSDFAALDKHVPPPFDKEWRGGPGQVIHDKFVVLDFNGDDPVVYTGSSNLASGGETSNGDNLIEIRDQAFATAFAVEAIRLVDHYHFRDAMENADPSAPLMLQGADPQGEKPWWDAYYDEREMKCQERELFARAQP